MNVSHLLREVAQPFSMDRHDTVIDAVGDIDTKVVSFYRTDLTIDADPAAAGVGDWVFIEQVDETAAAG
mgnify:CR=1 FL=1